LRTAFASLDAGRSGWIPAMALGTLFARVGPPGVSDQQLLELLLLEVRGKDATYTVEGMCSLDQAAYLYAKHRGEAESYLEARAHRHPLVRGRPAEPGDCDALEHEDLPGRAPKRYVCLMGCGFGVCGRCLAPKIADPMAARQVLEPPAESEPTVATEAPGAARAWAVRGQGPSEDAELQEALRLSLLDTQH